MSKIRSDAIWNGLPAEQREKMVHWLFVERIGYKEASERGLREFGVKGSETSVGRFYRRIEQEEAVNDLEEAIEAAAEVNATKGSLRELRASTMKMTGMRMLKNAMANGDVKELVALGRVLTQCEEREIQRGRLALARKRFEFKAAKEALKVAPLADKMARTVQEQQDALVVAAREAMFGDDPEGIYYEDEWGEEGEGIQNEKLKVKNEEAEPNFEHRMRGENGKRLSPPLVPTTASRGEGGDCAAGSVGSAGNAAAVAGSGGGDGRVSEPPDVGCYDRKGEAAGKPPEPADRNVCPTGARAGAAGKAGARPCVEGFEWVGTGALRETLEEGREKS